MNIGKLLLSALAGGVVMFLLAGLWHMQLMADFYASHSIGLPKDPVDFKFIIAGVLVLAVLMAYIYPQGYKGGTPWMEGLKFGMVMGLIWILPHSLILYAVEQGPNIKLIGVDAAWHLVEQGIGGIVIAMIYGKGS